MLSKENVFVVNKETLRSNEIPAIVVSGDTLPEVWEDAVLATWEAGANIPTEYDGKEDPDSKDATMMMVVANPQREPRIHKNIPDSFDGLEVYRQEVVRGIHNWKVKDRGWSYSYHDRLTNWPGKNFEFELPKVDQISALIDNLARVPHSRRAQAITWYPPVDQKHHEPPCLQRIWCRVIKSEGDLYMLEMNTHWRSRDALKAAFMNMYALTDFQRIIAEEISEMSGRNVIPGRYIDVSDSFHIYGSYHGRLEDMKRFLNSIQNNSFESRVIRSDDPRIQRAFNKAQEKIDKENKSK